MAQRLKELCGECNGLVRPGVRRLIEEVGAAGAGRHAAIVSICGKLVFKQWSDEQVLAFVVPLVNQHFADPGDDWSKEVVDALRHARQRDTAHWQNIRSKSLPGAPIGARRAAT
jgi:hypothetical protein